MQLQRGIDNGPFWDAMKGIHETHPNHPQASLAQQTLSPQRVQLARLAPEMPGVLYACHQESTDRFDQLPRVLGLLPTFLGSRPCIATQVSLRTAGGLENTQAWNRCRLSAAHYNAALHPPLSSSRLPMGVRAALVSACLLLGLLPDTLGQLQNLTIASSQAGAAQQQLTSSTAPCTVNAGECCRKLLP